MTAKARVSVLKTHPDRVVEDVGKAMQMADYRQHLAAGATTILKDNISWHFPFPGANTTPWQLEGTIRELRAGGYDELVCVENNTVVTDPKKGERLNRYLPVLHKAIEKCTCVEAKDSDAWPIRLLFLGARTFLDLLPIAGRPNSSAASMKKYP